jgi:gamma-glutamyltranspeptidase/glutathione hydrolase
MSTATFGDRYAPMRRFTSKALYQKYLTLTNRALEKSRCREQETLVKSFCSALRRTNVRPTLSLVALLAAFVSLASLATPRPEAAAIASAHPLATEAGRVTLERGGNAFDAAVAIAAALAVVEPASSGLGGGGFWLLYQASDGFATMVDARERAPLAASADMYLDKKGTPVPGLSLDGPLAAAIPGTPAALVHIARHYGHLPLSRSLAPAMRLAREGFTVTPRYRRLVRHRLSVLSPAAAQVFLDHGKVPEEGYIVRQPELTQALADIAEHGRRGFYGGERAIKLVNGVRAGGGIWTLQDLNTYQIRERVPVSGQYRQVRITSAALPSSGGIVLLEMLNILQSYDLTRLPRSTRVHLIVEAMRRGYRDRAAYMGDPDFVTVDSKRLLSLEYAAALAATINPDAATASAALPPAIEPGSGGSQTTHFSVIDKEGNRVAATLTINTAFGSGFMPPGTGVLLNNEMDDFVVKPGTANTYGLVGSSANAIAPGKRPLSSMTPTFLETPDVVVIAGTPGGSRIISMMLLTALELAEGRGAPKEWVALRRYHHQYLPDELSYEPGAFDAPTIRQLREMGHNLKERKGLYGNMQIVAWYKKLRLLRAASDPRGEGVAWVQRRD